MDDDDSNYDDTELVEPTDIVTDADVDVGYTMGYIEKTELTKLLIERATQLQQRIWSDVCPPVNPEIRALLPNETSVIRLALAEICKKDMDIPFSLLIDRGGHLLRIHTDLVLPEWVSEMIIIADVNGQPVLDKSLVEALYSPSISEIDAIVRDCEATKRIILRK